MGRKPRMTLCWDCKNAVLGCDWSRKGAPIEGWKAVETTLKCKGLDTPSFHVIECPEFVRDAKNGGLVRIK